MASEEFTLALQDWLSEQTGGLLNEQANQIRFDPDTVLALASTIYCSFVEWVEGVNIILGKLNTLVITICPLFLQVKIGVDIRVYEK